MTQRLFQSKMTIFIYSYANNGDGASNGRLSFTFKKSEDTKINIIRVKLSYVQFNIHEKFRSGYLSYEMKLFQCVQGRERHAFFMLWFCFPDRQSMFIIYSLDFLGYF